LEGGVFKKPGGKKICVKEGGGGGGGAEKLKKIKPPQHRFSSVFYKM